MLPGRKLRCLYMSLANRYSTARPDSYHQVLTGHQTTLE